MNKPMTTEEMAEFLDHRSDTSNDVHAAIARRLRLLEAEKQAWRHADSFYLDETGCPTPECGKAFAHATESLAQARAALDADERVEGR